MIALLGIGLLNEVEWGILEYLYKACQLVKAYSQTLA